MRCRPALTALAIVLAACTRTQAPASPAAPAPAATSVPAASTATSPAAKTLGHYTLGDVRLDLRDATRLPSEPGVVRVLLTPDVLDAEARQAVLASPQFPALVLAGRRIDGYPDRYPFVVVELRHEGAPSAAGVGSFCVMASSIGEPHHTDNINGMPDADARVERLQVDGTRLRMAFSGDTEISGVPRSWAFDIGG